MNTFKAMLVMTVVMLSGSVASAQGWWNMLGPVRNTLGSQFRHASPVGYQVLLAMNRSIPPQVKNRGGFAGYGGYYGVPGYGIPYGGLGYQAELAYWRSIPPQVKNEWAKQQRLGSINAMQPPVVYAPSPVPAAPPVVPPVGPSVSGTGGGVITAPPPSNVIPNSR